MGIPIHLTLLDIPRKDALEVSKKIEKVFEEWDRRASRFREDSELMKIITHSGEWVSVSSQLFVVIKKAVLLSKKTQGLFDISVGSYLAAANYGLPENYQLPKKVPNFTSIECNEENLSIRVAPNQVIEPAALVKGIAIDEAGSLLENISSWMINAGGDVLARGLFQHKKWRVGIQDPRDVQRILEVVEISDAAIATSGTYVVKKEHNGNSWHHEINPKTGKPTSSILSLSVVAASAYQADIVSTIAFLHDADAENYLRKRTEPFVIVTTDLQIISGNGWQALRG